MLKPVQLFLQFYHSHKHLEVPLNASEHLIGHSLVNRAEILEALSFFPSFLTGDIAQRALTDFKNVNRSPLEVPSIGIVLTDGHRYFRYRVGYNFLDPRAVSESLIVSTHEDFKPYEILFEERFPTAKDTAHAPFSASVFARMSLEEIANHYSPDCASVVETLLGFPALIDKARTID